MEEIEEQAWKQQMFVLVTGKAQRVIMGFNGPVWPDLGSLPSLPLHMAQEIYIFQNHRIIESQGLEGTSRDH